MLAASFIFIPGTCRCDVKRVAIIQMATLGDFMGLYYLRGAFSIEATRNL